MSPDPAVKAAKGLIRRKTVGVSGGAEPDGLPLKGGTSSRYPPHKSATGGGSKRL